MSGFGVKKVFGRSPFLRSGYGVRLEKQCNSGVRKLCTYSGAGRSFFLCRSCFLFGCGDRVHVGFSLLGSGLGPRPQGKGHR